MKSTNRLLSFFFFLTLLNLFVFSNCVNSEETTEITLEEKTEAEKIIEEAKRRSEQLSKQPPEKYLTLTIPYQDNEDYIISPVGFGEPISFIPVQVDTTSYKTWVVSSENEDNKSLFCYNKEESSTAKDQDQSDSVIDEEGSIEGNVIKDKVVIGNYIIDDFKFIEATEYESGFHDFKNGKLGLGYCEYASDEEKEFCLLHRLKKNGLIEKKLFSVREVSDSHGELVIGEISEEAQGEEFPQLKMADKEIYDNIEDEQFKMSWITNITHVLFRNETYDEDDNKKMFENAIALKDGLASLDTSCHYIEAPTKFMSEFEEKFFNKYYKNICRKVNSNGEFMFLCNAEKFEEVKSVNDELNLVLVMGSNGFNIPMNLLFEKTTADDYEFFVHFRGYSQNIWNLGHPFFHHYVVSFDQENSAIGIYGDNTFPVEVPEIPEEPPSNWWKYLLLILLILLILAALFLLGRYLGRQYRLRRGVDKNLLDNESLDDLSFNAGNNVNS